MPAYSNDDYLAAIRENNSPVLRDLLGEAFPSVRNWILNNNGTDADARDIFADTLEVLCRKVQTGNFTLTCKITTFLVEVASRHWLKKLRRKKFDAGVTTDDPMVLKQVAELMPPLETSESYQLYREKFLLLKDKCQNLLRLGILEGRSHEEIVKITGLSVAMSRKLRAKCVKKLTDLIHADARYRELKIRN